MTFIEKRRFPPLLLLVLFLSIIPLFVFACLGKSSKAENEATTAVISDEGTASDVISEEPPPAKNTGEYLIFHTAIQGNPFCMIVDIQQIQVSSFLGNPNIKGKANAWVVFPGASKYIYTKMGKFKKNPQVPLNLIDETLLLTTEKDEFAFYFPFGQEELLLLSDSIFLNRARTDQEKEIHYDLMPAKFIWKDRKIAGNLFYERRELPESASYANLFPFVGLEPGGRGYVLWAADGEFIYIEKVGEIGNENRARLAVMQDRRGRWQETFEVDLKEPSCAFSPSTCTGDSQLFQLQIPVWNMEGELDVMSAVQTSFEAEGQAEEPPAAAETSSPGIGRLWTSLQDLPEILGASPMEFCLLKGSIQINEKTRAVYGIGILAK